MKLYTLNGLKVILDVRNSYLSYIIIYSKVGSRYEEKSGITHFLEHNIFKGSKRFSYFQINEFFELYGNSIDAWTTKEGVTIYTSILSEKILQALDILFDIILYPTFENYENEKNVIIQEYKELLDNYEERCYYYLNKAIFKNHPLSREILGNIKNIKSFTKEDLIKRKNEVFSKDNVVILISGNFDEDKILKFIEDNIKFEYNYNLNLKSFKNYKPSIIEKKLQNFYNYTALGIPIFNYKPFKYILILISHMLGSGSSSILFDTIREKLGLVYDIHTFLDFYNEVAIFGISYSVEKKYNEKVILEVRKIIENLKNYIDDFQKAKQKLKTSIMADFEFYPNYLFATLNEYITSNRIITKENILQDIENLSLNDFLEVIEMIGKFDNYSIAIIK